MKYFLAFQKKKGIPVPSGTSNNEVLVKQLNAELMQLGFVLNKDLFERLSKCDINTLDVIYHDLTEGIKTLVPQGTYTPIYSGFPQSVQAMTDEELVINAYMHYLSEGQFRPIDEPVIQTAFPQAPPKFTEIRYMPDVEFDNIFYNLIYSNTSLSQFDKAIVDWYVRNDYSINMQNIKFKETLAYVGQVLLDSASITVLPTKNATDVLRIWTAYSGGDEGLKENTRFKNPSARQRRLLLASLDGCYNMEDAFKAEREKFLRFLYYLHPMTANHATKYPELYKYTKLLRNEPKELKTFNSRVEEAIANKSEEIWGLLKKRMGVFSRRLDHLIRVFDETAVTKWLENSPNIKQMIEIYNHLLNRDKDNQSRSAILASSSQSNVVNYKALEALDADVVKNSREAILEKLQATAKGQLGKVFIDPLLYHRPLAQNNRASSFSLSGKAIGTCESIGAGRVIRAYIHWEGRSDIDLSGFVIKNDNSIQKIGWNSSYNKLGVTYSGDNTGDYDKNAEYLDIDTQNIDPDVEWVIAEARIFSSSVRSYKNYAVPPLMGCTIMSAPKSVRNWTPKDMSQAMEITCDSRNIYLYAVHVPSRQIVYLDVSNEGTNVSTNEDAVRMKAFVSKFLATETEDGSIDWSTIKQGHVLNLLATEVVDDPKDADHIFTENTPQEEVANFL